MIQMPLPSPSRVRFLPRPDATARQAVRHPTVHRMSIIRLSTIRLSTIRLSRRPDPCHPRLTPFPPPPTASRDVLLFPSEL
ncbi:uncharacterized protein SCHCODRAFT_02642493 [Schizophyllum commune H4-8]|uniref:Expressed protein n=1 Tax=Schizophyllum commune (strain H4-8 / FGSC 9210) TaxID=578458 RepID=D8QLQ6_SCHCM|nr:uncharacterized protein SCHCODRAFT_02642493 [Schizophyllum commune H4-8]KAI5886711.1 hypothetical protein SCHCODRAFT_02642493 [Schizophyllum commune H4-8]